MKIMKKFIIPFLCIGLACIVTHACSKKGISGDESNLILGSYITLDSTINGFLDVSNSTSAVSIKVGKVVGVPVTTINIFLATGSNSEDTTGWVLIKSLPYSDGVVLSVTTTDIANALGSNPVAGNKYVLQNQVVTTDGRKFSTFNTPDTYNSFPAYNMALTWYATAVCAFTGNMAGNYDLTKDAWDDYGASASNPVLIPNAVVDGPGANQISIYVYPGPAAGTETGPMIVNVDPVTGTATIVKSDVGNYGPGAEAIVTGSGIIFDCTGYIDLKIDWNVGGSDYGVYEMILQKK
jgi:hypothetical protein